MGPVPARFMGREVRLSPCDVSCDHRSCCEEGLYPPTVCVAAINFQISQKLTLTSWSAYVGWDLSGRSVIFAS